MSIFLENLAAHVREMNYPIYTLAEKRVGERVETITLQKANPCQNSYSVAKAFVVTAIGLLYDEGRLSVTDRVLEVLGDEVSPSTRAAMSAEWERVTVEDALCHRLALPKNFLDIDCTHAADFGKDYLAFMLTYPLSGAHGGERVYTDGAYYLLARVAERVAGCPLDNFLWQRLFFKMGFREAAWSHCPKGHCMGATGLYIATEDMVKLGELYLNGGVWQGELLLSPAWVSAVLTRGYEIRPVGNGMFAKGGMRGQMLLIDPVSRRAVAWHGCGTVDKEELFAYIETLRA